MTFTPIPRASGAIVGLVVGVLAMLGLTASAASGAGPAELSKEELAPISQSTHGSGVFGRWGRDAFGLPFFNYTANEHGDPRAVNQELQGGLGEGLVDPTDAFHLVGNNNIAGFGVNHGYTLLFSAGDEPEYTNWYDPEENHFAGGYGYMKVDGKVVSTMTDHARETAQTERHFGIGYYRRKMGSNGITADERVYAPLGDVPALRHDVTLHNHTQRTRELTWWEYWDVNPVQVAGVINPQRTPRGLKAASYDPASKTLRVGQLQDSLDTWTDAPHSIFLSALDAPVKGYETDTRSFFGDGSGAQPAAVVNDRASNSLAPGAAYGDGGSSMFGMRSPVRLRPGQSVTLRYVYGSAAPSEIDPLVARLRDVERPFARNQRAWFDYVPHVSLPGREAWVAREMAWHAYATRALTLWEGFCGRHVLDEAGTYLFGSGVNLGATAYNNVAHTYTKPGLSRETIRFWAEQQENAPAAEMSYESGANCSLDVPDFKYNINNLDVSFLYAVVQYVMATRDFDFLNERVAWRGGGRAPLWEHVKVAYRHQEQVVGRGPHGEYRMLDGDFSDVLAQTEGATESMDATGLGAFVYPLLAEIAKSRGDGEFASAVRASGEQNMDVIEREWTGRWYARGYAGDRQMGSGALYAVPQGWPMLAGATSRDQALKLIAGYKRFILGIGAPSFLNGPSKFGTPIAPARADPDVTERSPGPGSGDAAVDLEGSWWEVNGPIIWGFARLDEVIDDRTAHRFAWKLYKLNTQGAHATAFPDRWAGTTSLDDRCSPWYAGTSGGSAELSYGDGDPASCSLAFFNTFLGWNAYAHSFMSWDSFTLAGIQGTPTGWIVRPRLPFKRYSFRAPHVGLSVERRQMRGYFKPEGGGDADVEVVLPKAATGRAQVWVNGREARARRAGRRVTFTISPRAEMTSDWVIRWGARKEGKPRA